MVKMPNGGIVGVWGSGTGGMANAFDGIGDMFSNMKYFAFAGIAVVGGVLLMMAFSFASGRQDLAGTVQGAADIAKTVTTKGMM